jgi:predicted nucleic acid-binding protein
MIVDTSVFLGMYHEPDVHHETALRLFREIEPREGILISDLLANELATVMLRKTGIEKTNIVLDTLFNAENVRIHYTCKADFLEILELFKKQKKTDNLSFVDCSIIWLSRHYGAKVASFDKNLNSALEFAKQ